MAKSNSKLKAVSKPTQTDRSEINAYLCGEHVSQIADHLQDLSNLLYENQNRFKCDPLIVGTQLLLQGFATGLQQTANHLNPKAAE